MRSPDAVKQTAAPAADGYTPAAARPEPSPAPKRRRARRWMKVLGAIAAACVSLWLLRVPLLRAAAHFLSVSDPVARADAIFVLGGDPDIRPYAAAGLYRRGLAPRVLVPGMETGRLAADGLLPTQTELFQRVLHKEGVPDSAVQVLNLPGGTSSTTEDAEVLADWVRWTGAHSVIAVTTTYHTRRSRLALRRALKGTGVRLMMYGAPTRGYSESDWWRYEGGLTTYFNEYVKLLRYEVAGGAS